MNSKLRLRWTVICFLWMISMGFTGWNLAKIDAVAAGRIENENLRKESLFQRHNAQRLEQIAAGQQALFMEVESLDLGMVALRCRLRALAAAFHLEDLVIEAELNQIGDNRIPCRVSLAGAFENVIGFLTASSEYAYLLPRQTQIGLLPSASSVHLEMSLFVQYKIVAPAAPAEPLPKMTTQPLEAQGRPL